MGTHLAWTSGWLPGGGRPKLGSEGQVGRRRPKEEWQCFSLCMCKVSTCKGPGEKARREKTPGRTPEGSDASWEPESH